MGNRLLSAFAMSAEKFEGWAREMERHGTDFLYGYSSVLARFARWLKSSGRRPRAGRLKAVVATAEMLPPADRDVIAEVFGCPVAAEYGCRDGGLIAHECPAGGLHLMHDAVHVEILDAHGDPVADGVEGEVCVTNLYARAFPMIRYRLGDRAVRSPQPCVCGRPHPVLSHLLGRSTDTLVRDDGVRVHGLALIYVLRELPGVDRFRIHQQKNRQVAIHVVPGAEFDRARISTGIVDRVRKVLGPGIEVEVDLVEDLPVLPSGKHRYVLCDVPETGD